MRKLPCLRFYIRMTIRSLRTLVPLGIMLLSLFASAQNSGKYLVYVGTYTEDKAQGKGIYAFRYDAATQQITPLGLAAETVNPSWVAFDPSGKYLYAVNELPNYKGPNSGGLSAFKIDRATGKLTFLNEVPTRGADPCYVTVDKTGKWVLVANYTGGSVAVFPILADGKLGEASDFVQHQGHGANAERQEGPHAHSIDLSPDNRFAFVDDLGLDQLKVYKFDSAKGKLTPSDPAFVKLDDGAGPRHFALHPSAKFAYVVSEMQGSVTALSVDSSAGTFARLQTIATLPKDYKGLTEDAEVLAHPSGRFVYASNRGQASSIAIFAVDPAKGTLTLVDVASAGVKIPRGVAIDPTGKLLLTAGQDSNNIAVFSIDEKTGRMTPTGKTFDVGTPVCIKFLRVE